MKYICGTKYVSGALQDFLPGEADGIYSFEVVMASDYEDLALAARDLLKYLDDHDWGHVPEGATADRLRALVAECPIPLRGTGQ